MGCLAVAHYGAIKSHPTRSAMTFSDSPVDPSAGECNGCTVTTASTGGTSPGEQALSPDTPARSPSAGCDSLPLQTLTPRNPTSANLGSSTTNCVVDGSEFWSSVWYFRVRPIDFTLMCQCHHSVTLSLVMRTCLPFASPVVVIVNGRVLRTYTPNDDNWFTQHIVIPGEYLQQGVNLISLETPATAQTRLGIPLGIWVQSASVGWNPGEAQASEN